MKKIQQIGIIGLSALGICSTLNAANIPQWWAMRGLINTNAATNDFAPANIGQLKNVAYQTWVEMTNQLAQVDVQVESRMSQVEGQTNGWNTAYDWGNHATNGYLKVESDPQVGANTANCVPKWNGNALVSGSVFDNNGNVGIGTTIPGATLDVNGTAKASNLVVGTGTATGVYAVAQGHQTIANGRYSHAAGYKAKATNNNTYVWSDGTEIGSTMEDQYTVRAGNGIRLLGGPVQIGSDIDTNIYTKLHIVGNDHQLVLEHTGLPDKTVALICNDYNHNGGSFTIQRRPISGIWDTNAEVLVDVSLASGNVGIGTTTPPTAKLDVAGTVKADQAQYTAQASATITNSSAPDGTFKVSTDGKLMLWFGAHWYVFTPEAIVTPPPTNTNAPTGMVWVQGGTLPDIGNGALTVSSFCIGQTEVTWAQWQAVQAFAATNSYDLAGIGSGCATNHPVNSVNWYDAVKWCNAKSEQEGRTPVYTVTNAVYRSGQNDAVTVNASANGYRLPTDAEWEFAARGGTLTHGYIYSGGTNLNMLGWYAGNSTGAACDLGGGRGTWPVGQKTANEIGLYDMSGNAWEWCFDWYPGYVGTYRVLRGGDWFNGENYCRMSTRWYTATSYRGSTYCGFRLACNAGQ